MRSVVAVTSRDTGNPGVSTQQSLQSIRSKQAAIIGRTLIDDCDRVKNSTVDCEIAMDLSATLSNPHFLEGK